MRNFVTDEDLRKFFPRITEFLGSQRVDFGWQTAEAFQQTVDSMRVRGIEVRQLMRPLDLLYVGDDPPETITSVVKTTTWQSECLVGTDGFNRVVVDVSALVTTAGTEVYVVELQGSRDLNVDESNPPTNWTTVWKAQVKRLGQLTSQFADEYPYYRISITITGAGSPSITFTALLYETWIERAVIHKSLSMIFADFSKVKDDIWERRSDKEEQEYDNALQMAQFYVDRNNDNLPDSSGEEGGMEAWR